MQNRLTKARIPHFKMPIRRHGMMHPDIEALIKTLRTYSEEFANYESEIQMHIKRNKFSTEGMETLHEQLKKRVVELETNQSELMKHQKSKETDTTDKIERLASMGTQIDASTLIEALQGLRVEVLTNVEKAERSQAERIDDIQETVRGFSEPLYEKLDSFKDEVQESLEQLKTKGARMKTELDEKVDMAYLDGEMDILIEMLGKIKGVKSDSKGESEQENLV